MSPRESPVDFGLSPDDDNLDVGDRRLSACPPPHPCLPPPRKLSWKVRAQLWLYEKAVLLSMVALVSMEPVISKMGGLQQEEQTTGNDAFQERRQQQATC